MRIVEAVTAFYTQPLVVGGAIAALHKHDFVVLHVVGELAAHTTVWADGVHLLVWNREGRLARRHECPGGAGLHAFATGHTGGGAHGVVHVEDNLGMLAPKGQADHIIDLLISTGPQASGALDAGI